MTSLRLAGRAVSFDPRLAWRALRTDIASMPRALKLWLGFLLGVMAIGALSVARAFFIPGDKGVATTPTVEWGLLIVGYVFFAITTSGLCLASSLGTVFGIDRFRPLEKRHAVLAVLCLVTALGVIAVDLHFPIRLVFGVGLNPQPTSPMWWMGVAYGAYLCFLLVEVWSIFWHHPRVHQWACLMASIAAIVAPSTLGAVFAVLGARPFWNSVFTPLHMLAAAFVSGVALLAVVFYVLGRLRLVGWERGIALAQPALRVLLVIGLLAVGALVGVQLLGGLTTSDSGLRAATTLLLSGPLAPGFVGVRLVGGILLPLLLLLLPWTRTPAGLGLAASLALLGVFADRFTFVLAGQMAPVTAVSGVVSVPYAAYSASLVEIGIICGGAALIAFGYTLAERYLDLSETAEAHPLFRLPRGLVESVQAVRRAVDDLRRRRLPARPDEAPAEEGA